MLPSNYTIIQIKFKCLHFKNETKSYRLGENIFIHTMEYYSVIKIKNC